MLEITEKYTQAAMTTQGRMVWTLLSVLLSLVCVVSVSRDCQEMVVCTAELKTLNETISLRAGTSQMIDTCIKLTQAFPVCYEMARKACDLSFGDTLPYQVLYYNIKESCDTACPIFKPLIDCEKNVAYVDLSTNKNAYCQSYIESMDCLDNILMNITCSFGEKTKALVLDTVYDQEARKFGDGVCMTAEACPDIDRSVTAVTSCLRTWKETSDYSESGIDTLKECISNTAMCSDALRMVPFYEKSLTGIDVVLPLTTEYTETITIATTENIPMTSSVRSPAPSTTTSISRAIQTDAMEITSEIVTKPLGTTGTTEIVTTPFDTSTTEIVTKPTEIVTKPTEIVTKLLDTTGTTEIVTTPFDTSTTEIVTKPTEIVTKPTEIVTKPFDTSTTEIVTKPIDTTGTEIVTKPLDTSTTEIVTKPTEIVTKPFDTSTTEIVTKPFDTSTTEIVTKPLDTTGTTEIVTTRFLSTDATVVTVKKRKVIKTDSPTNTDFTISNGSTNSSHKSTIEATKLPLTNDDHGDDVVMVTSSTRVVEQQEVTTFLSPRQPVNTEKSGTTMDKSTTAMFVVREKNTTSIPLSDTARLSMTMDEKGSTSVKALRSTPKLMTDPAAQEPTSTGREITRTESSSVTIKIGTSSATQSSSMSVTDISFAKSTHPSSSVTSLTSKSPNKEHHNDGTNGGGNTFRPRTTLLYIVVTITAYFLT